MMLDNVWFVVKNYQTRPYVFRVSCFGGVRLRVYNRLAKEYVL